MLWKNKKNVRWHLEKEFGSSILFLKNNSGNNLVASSAFTVEELAVENFYLKQQLNILTSTDKDKLVEQASMVIRQAIKNDTTAATPWPFHPSDVNKTYYSMPQQLELFLMGLLTGDCHNKMPSKKNTLLIKSFSQDLVYAVTNGKQKPPKHYLLPYAVKTLTGNVELIKRLNRLGHGV